MATGVVEVRWSQEQEGESSSAQARDCVRNEAGRKVGNDVDYEVTNVDVEWCTWFFILTRIGHSMLAYLLVKTGVILILVSSHDTLRLVCINVKITFKI